MLVPNQIKNFAFQQAGRGAYKAADVDAFKQKVYTAYSELFSEHSAVKGKFASLAALVEEYNEGKNAIATTMIKAQSFADETIKQANEKAEQILSAANAQAEQLLEQKKLEADTYAAEKTANADSYFSRAEGELDSVLQMAAKEAEAYIASVNEKAAAVIANANEQAAKIVASAYADAQKARSTCDDIIEQANIKLNAIKAEVAGFRKETKRLLSIITPAVDDIDVPDDISPLDLVTAEPESQPTPVESMVDSLEPFKFDPYSAKNDSEEIEPSEESAMLDDTEEPVETESFVADTETSDGIDISDDTEPLIISEKLSASIFKSLDDFEKLIDSTANGEDIGLSDGGIAGFNANGFNLTDFDEE